MRTAQRVLLTLSQVALCLPFVAVTDCSTGTTSVFTGFEVYAEASGGWIWFATGLAMALLLWGWPWRPGDTPSATAPGLGLRAVAAVVGLGAAFATPVLAYLFDEVRPRVGWVLQLLCWTPLYLGYLGGAARAVARHRDGDSTARAEKAAAFLVVVAPFPISLLTTREDEGISFWDGPVSLMISIPIALALVGVGRRASTSRRWRTAVWGVAALWLFGWTTALTG